MQQVENLSLCFLFSNSTITEILPKTAVAMKKENKKKGGGGGKMCKMINHFGWDKLMKNTNK